MKSIIPEKLKKPLNLTAMILVNVFVFLFAIVLLVNQIADDNAAILNKVLPNVKLQDIIPAPDADKIDSEYYKSPFGSVAETKANSENYSQKVVEEGAVLLKNNNGALPLASGNTVSLFSVSSVNLVYAGTGSSGTNTSGTVTLKQGMEKYGLKVNESLWNSYKSQNGTYGRGSAGGSIGTTFSIKEVPWATVGAAKTERANAAIFVLARNGGEGADLTISGGSTSDMTNGNYLALSPQEADVLKNLKALKEGGTFDSIIVLLNSANQVESAFIDDPEYGIDAALWIGDIGSTGIYGACKLIAGQANPSGRLADTFWKYHYQNPALTNFGNFTVGGGNLISHGNSNHYLVYQEGIYLGYRYTESRYEDYVMGVDGVGNFDYSEVVSYPFGYGMSYSNFTYSNFSVTEPKVGTHRVTVTVTNNADSLMRGKEAVQIYLQKPYTDYDKDFAIEKASVELVAFAKTKELAPGESQTLTIDVDEKYFTSYDVEARGGKGSYIIEAGTYYLTAAKDAHDAVNNILATKGKSSSGDIVVIGNHNGAGNNRLVAAVTKKFNDDKYAVSGATGNEISNKFDNADLNRYEGRGDNHVEYITRSDWENTVKLGYSSTYTKLNNQVVVTGTAQMKEDIKTPTIEKDDIEYPTYGADNGLSLIDLRQKTDGTPIEYDNELWDKLLDELTWEQTVGLLSNGLRLTAAVGAPIHKPETIDHNGATGPTQPYNDGGKVNRGLAVRNEDPDRGQKPTVYPCNVIVASTYNTDLIYEYGDALGNDCLWAGYSGLYGPGMNAHRTAYGGRTFEYYSEDPVLAGLIAAAEVKGIQAYGCNVYLKHCFLNDQESYREGICTWANEQSIREIYLKPFQIAIEEGGAMNVMTGFNRLGVVWTGHQGFCNTVLHDEFGMRGLSVSDWYQTGYMTLVGGVMNGNDLPDGTQTSGNHFSGYDKGYGKLAWAMRESAHRILYHAVQSNAMNTFAPGTQVIPLTPWWKTMMTAIVIVITVLFALSVAFLAAMVTFRIIDWFAARKSAPTMATATAGSDEGAADAKADEGETSGEISVTASIESPDDDEW